MIDIIVDIETLGRSPRCPITQFSAVAFDRDNNFKVVSTFDLSTEIKGEVTVNAETLKWWLEENPNLLLKQLNGVHSPKYETQKGTYHPYHRYYGLCSNEKEIIKRFCDWFYNLTVDYGERNILLWGNGILFDNRIIKEKCELYGIEYPIFYRNDRDIRTLTQIAADITGCESEKAFREQFVNTANEEHNSFNDCLNEYEAVKAALKIIGWVAC